MSIKEQGQGRRAAGLAAIGAVRMGRRAVLTTLTLLAGAVAGHAEAREFAYPAHAQRVVVGAALKSAVPPELALAVARAGRDERLTGAETPEAVGIMHVLPSVAQAELGVQAYGLGDARANAGIGVALLERLYRRYGERWDLALSHYRGGLLPRCAGRPVAHVHTVDYVAGVMEWWRRYQEDKTVAALTGGSGNDAARGARPDTEANARTPGAPGATQAHGSGNGAAWLDWRGRFRSDDQPAYGNDRSLRFF